MRISKIFGLAIFIVVLLVGIQREPIDGLLDELWSQFCASHSEDVAQQQPASTLPRLSAAWADPTPVPCPTPPTGYASLPSVEATGDVVVPLALGSGPGIGNGNPNLCFVYQSLPAAPVLRVERGDTLKVAVTNTITNNGSDPTENCTIDNYPAGPPVSPTCTTPETGHVAVPGPNGTFYPIQANVRHLADGTTNLHVHGFSDVSPRPCHDEVIRSTIYPANWDGTISPPLLPCQSSPNELTYTYDIPADHPAGLYWYHTHRHGQAFSQTMMGASGPIVIESDVDAYREKLGVTDDVMIVRDFPARFVSATAPTIQNREALGRLYAHERGHTPPQDPAIDPRIDRDNEISCPRSAPDAGGKAFTVLTLNGALVQEGAQFPPPDSQVLSKTMTDGERQIWRLVNASAETYVSPQLVLSINGKTQVLPLVITALDGVPVHDDSGRPQFDVVDTTKHPLLVATANRVEFVVHAPPPGATLYLDSLPVIPGCTGDAMPARRLLRVTSTPAQGAATTSDIATGENDHDLLAQQPETQYTHMLDTRPGVTRVFAFTEYWHTFTVAKSKWLTEPPTVNPALNVADFYLTMIDSSDGQGKPVAIKPFDPHVKDPDVVIHLNGQESVTEDWIIQNYTLELHNFHIHQMHFRDITSGDAIDSRAPILDTVNVPAATRVHSAEDDVDVPMTPGFVRLRLKFTRAMIGEFVFHCHLLAHEDGGMMKKIRVVAD